MQKVDLLLDIEPVKNIKNNCLEDVVVTICKWAKREHQMMFLDLRMVQIEETSEEKRSMGKRIKTPYTFYKMELLDRFHGIQVSYFDKETFNLELAYESLVVNKPMFAFIDTYYLPWHAYYKKVSGTHAILINGINHSTGQLICTDPFYLLKNQNLSTEEFHEGCSTFCTIIIKKPPLYKDTDILTFLKQQLTHYVASGSLEALGIFADQIQKIDLMDEGEDGSLSLLNVPLFIQLRNIHKSKQNYARALHYISETYNLPYLLSYSQKMTTIGNVWESVRGILMKLYIKKADVPDMLAHVSTKIKSVISQEQDLVQNMLQQLGHKHQTWDNESMITANLPIQFKANRKIPIDLSGACNNKGVTNSREIFADMTGWNQFLLVRQPLSKVIYVEEGDYMFSLSENMAFDNISAVGEEIAVSGICGHFLAVMGCSDNGSVEEEITITYKSGSKETLRVLFSNWATGPAPHEKAAVTGVIGRPSVTNFPDQIAQIYASRYVLHVSEPIVSITLPLSPVIHIFALTLETNFHECEYL